MKRTLSLLLALALVFTMIPAVFAADVKDEIDFDEFPGHEGNPEVAVIGQEYTTVFEDHYYTITPAEAGNLQFTTAVTVNGADVAAEALYAVEAGVTYTVVVTGAGATWSAAYAATCEHTLAYTDNGDGTHKVTCSVCSEVVVDNENHTFVDGTCVCGAKEGPTYDSNIKFIQKSLSFQKYIGLQLIASNKNVVNKFDDVYIMAKQVATDGTVRFDGRIDGRAYNGGTTYTIYEVLVESWDMTDSITVTFYAEKDGVTYYGESYTATIEALALEKLKTYYDATNMDACRVLVDMLNYGAEVQKAFPDHNATSLPNTQLETLGYSNLGTAEDPAFTATDSESGTETIPLYRMAFSMKSKVEFQPIFKTKGYDVSKLEIRYTVKGVTTTIPGSTLVASGSSYHYAYIAVDASDMREMFDIAMYNSETGELVSKIFTCSVESKAAAYYNDVSSAYRPVVIAMLKYGDAVSVIS